MLDGFGRTICFCGEDCDRMGYPGSDVREWKVVLEISSSTTTVPVSKEFTLMVRDHEA